jgi:hypothetical protein
VHRVIVSSHSHSHSHSHSLRLRRSLQGLVSSDLFILARMEKLQRETECVAKMRTLLDAVGIPVKNNEVLTKVCAVLCM